MKESWEEKEREINFDLMCINSTTLWVDIK